MPDASIVNFAMTSKVSQSGVFVVVDYPNNKQDQFRFASATLASQFITGIADFLTSQSGILTLKSITPATAVAAAAVNAVLLGTGFQYDLSGGVFGGTVTVGGSATVITFVNSNTLLLSFNAPNPAGTYDVVYTTATGATVTLTGVWVST